MAKGKTNKTGTSYAGRGGGRGRGRGRGGRGGGRGTTYSGSAKSPGELKALKKAEKLYSQKKVAKARQHESEQLLAVLVPQQIEMQIQTMIMSKQLKGKSAIRKARKQLMAAQTKQAKKDQKKRKASKKSKYDKNFFVFIHLVVGECLLRRLRADATTPALGVEVEGEEEEKEEKDVLSCGNRVYPAVNPSGDDVVLFRSVAAAEAGRQRRKASAVMQFKVFDPGGS